MKDGGVIIAKRVEKTTWEVTLRTYWLIGNFCVSHRILDLIIFNTRLSKGLFISFNKEDFFTILWILEILPMKSNLLYLRISRGIENWYKAKVPPKIPRNKRSSTVCYSYIVTRLVLGIMLVLRDLHVRF